MKEEVDKKSFVIQFNITKYVQSIRGRIFQWIGSIGLFTKVDTIAYADIACIGFFSLFYPDHQNRDILHKYLPEYLRNHVEDDMEISIYSRQIYIGKGIHKAETRVSVVNVAKHHAKASIEALIDCPFPDYDGFTFVPFVRNDQSYNETLRSIFDSHTAFVEEVGCITINNLFLYCPSMHFLHKYQCLKNVLMSTNHEGLICDIDGSATKETQIIYYKSNKKFLQPFLTSILDLLRKHVSPECLPHCFRPKDGNNSLNIKSYDESKTKSNKQHMKAKANRKKSSFRNVRYHATTTNNHSRTQTASYASVANIDHSEQSTAVTNGNSNRLLTIVPHMESIFSREQIAEIVLDVVNKNNTIPKTSIVSDIITTSVHQLRNTIQEREIANLTASKRDIENMLSKFNVTYPSMSYAEVSGMIAASSNTLRAEHNTQISNIRNEVSSSCGLLGDSLRMLSELIRANSEQIRSNNEYQITLARTMMGPPVHPLFGENRIKVRRPLQ